MTTDPYPRAGTPGPAAARHAHPLVMTSDNRLEGAAGFQAYRDAIAETSDILLPGSAERFRARAIVHHLGSAILTDVRTSSLAYTRSVRHVAHAGYDHYQVSVNLNADVRYEFGRQSCSQRPGDVIILDSARSHRSHTLAPPRGLACNATVFIPRAAIAPLLPSSLEGEQSFRLSREQPEARLLRDHICQMLKTVAADPHAALAAAVADLTGVLSRVLSGGRDISPLAQERLRRATLDSLKRLVARYLDAPTLSVDLICARSGWSRSTIYRLFEEEGGLARYIRQQHLLCAFRELMSAQQPRRRIVDVALEHQFSSEATFNRAFRRAFGIPPGEVRGLAARAREDSLSDRRPRTRGESDAIHWIMRLGTGVAG
ncbi:MAG: helix-turn-helix domain-containing protein [Steroidobacteraceae bacterium]